MINFKIKTAVVYLFGNKTAFQLVLTVVMLLFLLTILPICTMIGFTGLVRFGVRGWDEQISKFSSRPLIVRFADILEPVV